MTSEEWTKIAMDAAAALGLHHRVPVVVLIGIPDTSDVAEGFIGPPQNEMRMIIQALHGFRTTMHQEDFVPPKTGEN